MEYRRSSLIVNKQPVVNANANSHIYVSFAGTLGNPNGVGLTDALTMWWDDDRIEATVTRQYVASKLRSDEQEKLDEVVGFGDGLTDDTYMDWIREKAKRIFLILVDINVPDQIFGVIDDSWDDDDLPIPLDQIERLQLTYDKSERLERRFFQRQFSYLLKYMQKGDHLCYDDMDVVPLELTETRSAAALYNPAQNITDRVYLPGKPDDVFVRRRIPLGPEQDQYPREEFISCIEALKALQHDHSVNVWASYMHRGMGYLLLTPVHEINLKSILVATPQSIKILSKQDRRILFVNWLHCLTESLAHLHGKGLAQCNIIPSNIMIDQDNKIFFGPSSTYPMLDSDIDKRSQSSELYEYSAPEAFSSCPLNPISNNDTPKLPQDRRTSVLASSRARRSLTLFGGNYALNFASSESTYTTSTNLNTNFKPCTSRETRTVIASSSLHYDPQKADIFSLGTIYLEIINFLLKRTTRSFSTYRSQKSNTRDTSFHNNLAQVDMWITSLIKEASKKQDQIFRGIKPILNITKKMLSPEPTMRPSAREIQETLYDIVANKCELGIGKIHCVPPACNPNSQLQVGFDALRRASQRAAAAACMSVAGPLGEDVEKGDLALGNGGVITGVETRRMVVREKGGDVISVGDKSSSKESGKMKGKGSSEGDRGKKKAKAKAWKAPVYAELSFG